MRNKSVKVGLAVLAAGAVLAVQSFGADSEKYARNAKDQFSANDIIGKKVKNFQDDDLGKIHDLIVNWNSGTAPYAVILAGGVLGAGGSKIAVPLTALQPSADGKAMLLSATKNQLHAATKATNDTWMAVASSEWAKNIDGFFGTPDRATGRDRISQEPGDRRYVRDPAPKGSEALMAPADAALCERICEATDLVNVRVENGAVHLYGTVENEDARKDIESRIRTVQGVNRVESHLRVRNK
jgi:sporulation protein YlmC with PRC-barrel domain